MHFECRVPGYVQHNHTQKHCQLGSICRWLRESLTRGYTCMFNWTKVLPNSFSLPIPFWDPLKFDQKVPHVFLLILNAHHTICFSVTYNMVLMLINLLVALSWHVEYTQCKALFCWSPNQLAFWKSSEWLTKVCGSCALCNWGTIQQAQELWISVSRSKIVL